MALGCLLVVGYAAAMIGSGFRLLHAEIRSNGFPLAPARPHRRCGRRAAGRAMAVLPRDPAASGAAPMDRPGLRRRRAGRRRRRAPRGAFSSSGAVAAAGFLTLAVAWLTTTFLAVQRARHHDLDAHREWAIRSGSLAFAAVTLRLYLSVGLSATGGDFARVYPVVAWLSWMPNLLVAQWLIGRPGVVPVPLGSATEVSRRP